MKTSNDNQLTTPPAPSSSDLLAARWSQAQKDKAWGIVNDIAEDIDNHETRAELRQALAIYADMLCDALQKRACEKTEKMMEAVNKLAELMAANEKSSATAEVKP
jgi:hypothetical protein